MKRLALVTLLACPCGAPAFAIEPYPNEYESGAYPDSLAAPDKPGRDSDEAEAAIQAGRDLTEVLAPTSAGPAYTDHPYITGGNFGKPGCE